MKDFAGRIAVVTGGGTGMGRELVRQLVAEGCNVAMCDVSTEAMVENNGLRQEEILAQGPRITTHAADMADEAQVGRVRDEVADRRGAEPTQGPLNQSLMSGGGSMIANSRAE